MSDPEEITIIVHSAKDLKGKKPGRHKYSVIFGLGGTKFRTQTVKEPSGNPDWNEETIVSVSNILDQVFFIATEKDDILGQILIPVTSLRAVKGQAKRAPLQPHKKCPQPKGELVYQVYVSKYRSQGDHVPVIMGTGSTVPDNIRPRSAFQRLKKRMASPVAQRKSKREDSIKSQDIKSQKSGLSLNKRFSKSIQDLFSFNKFSASESTNVDDNISVSSSQKSSTIKSKQKKKFSLSFLSVSHDLDKMGDEPVITSCTPNSGPVDRPTRLTIEGRNLASGKSDILSLKIAGCDCTDTVEFESSTRIYCTTHFWKVCTGPIVIDTISGDITEFKDGFSFYEELDANQNSNASTTNPFENSESTEHELEISLGGREIKSGSSTLPRIRTHSSTATTPQTPQNTSTPTAPGRYMKKHGRHASETVTMAINKTPVEHISKEELQAKISALEEENAALKKDNVEMKSYIDKLVAKCMLHCPEALAQEDNEKTKLFVL